MVPQETLVLEKAARDAQNTVSKAWATRQKTSTNFWKRFGGQIRVILMKRNDDDEVRVCREWYGVDGKEIVTRKERKEKYCGVQGLVRKQYEVNWYEVV